MEGRKENKYNLNGVCPECGKLFKVELVIATELVETEESKKAEAKADGEKGEPERPGESPAESGNVRPADGEAGTGEARPGPAADDPAKGKRPKKAGGR